MHTNASLDYSRLPAFDIFYSPAVVDTVRQTVRTNQTKNVKKTNLFKKKAPPNFLRSLLYVQHGVTILSR